MRSRLSRRARETNCSMADGVLESDDIRFVILEAIPQPVNRPGVLLFVEVPHWAMWDFNGAASGLSMALPRLFGGGVELGFVKFPARLRTLPDGTNFPAPLLSTCEVTQRHSLSRLIRGDIPFALHCAS
jgi:hypothetical protein